MPLGFCLLDILGWKTKVKGHKRVGKGHLVKNIHNNDYDMCLLRETKEKNYN